METKAFLTKAASNRILFALWDLALRARPLTLIDPHCAVPQSHPDRRGEREGGRQAALLNAVELSPFSRAE